MVIHINEIPPEGLTLNLKLDIDLSDRTAATTSCTALLAIKPAGSRSYHCTGRVQASLELECSRCLEKFGFPVDSTWEIDLLPVDTLGGESERELIPGELDTEFYSGDTIDTADLVREQILIAVPMIPLHSKDCRGLCRICGANLNTTSCGHEQNAPGEFGAFSTLKDLLTKKKEQ